MRISRIVAGLVGLLATTLVFVLAVVALVGSPEFLQWLPDGVVQWMPQADSWWGSLRGLGVMLVGLTLVLLLFAIPLVLLYQFFRPSSGDDSPSSESSPSARDDPALQRLRERYANGDIDDEEYERRLRRLQS